MDKKVAILIDSILHDVEKIEGRIVADQQTRTRESNLWLKAIRQIKKEIFELVEREDQIDNQTEGRDGT